MGARIIVEEHYEIERMRLNAERRRFLNGELGSSPEPWLYHVAGGIAARLIEQTSMSMSKRAKLGIDSTDLIFRIEAYREACKQYCLDDALQSFEKEISNYR